MDIPIQHVNGDILKAMNRRGDAEYLSGLMAKIRDKVPGVTLRTTLIAGFPGETEEQFAQLCEFIGEAGFDRLGCFAYSQEEDTPAAAMPGQIDEETKQRRCEIIMESQMEIMSRKLEVFVGQTLEVLCEGFDRYAEAWFGRSAMDAPDIDTKVFFTTKVPVKPGDYVRVLVEAVMDSDLIGIRA